MDGLDIESTFATNVDRINHSGYPSSNENGKIELDALIPGAKYRIELGDEKHRDFTATPGQTIDLG